MSLSRAVAGSCCSWTTRPVLQTMSPRSSRWAANDTPPICPSDWWCCQHQMICPQFPFPCLMAVLDGKSLHHHPPTHICVSPRTQLIHRDRCYDIPSLRFFNFNIFVRHFSIAVPPQHRIHNCWMMWYLMHVIFVSSLILIFTCCYRPALLLPRSDATPILNEHKLDGNGIINVYGNLNETFRLCWFPWLLMGADAVEMGCT